MIRRVTPVEANQVFDLMRSVYANHAFLEQGVDTYCEQLETDEYVSLGDFDQECLQAHAGFRVHADFVLINALVVDPATRGAGLGRKIFETRLDYINGEHSPDFIVGYSMMQHLWSQKLYHDTFMPIGLDIGYSDIYHKNDARYNKGASSNAEIVLCQRASSKDCAIDLRLPKSDQVFAQQVLDKVGVTCQFVEEAEQTTDSKVFLGFQPGIKEGLFSPAFLSESAAANFDPLLTSNQQRQNFVDTLRIRYEQNSRS